MNEKALTEPMDIDDDEQTAEKDQTKNTKMDTESLRPIAVLIDALSQEDMQVRIGALRKVNRIAEALGPDRTRKELIPYLSDMLDDDDDVLRIICEVLLQLLDYVGGEQYYHTLIQPYETLCVVEENSIRLLALKKLATLTAKIPEKLVLDHLPPLFNRLATSDWHTARTAAAGVAPDIYVRLAHNKESSEKLEKDFLKLAEDAMPQVRRAVAESIGLLALKMKPEIAEEKVFDHLVKLAADEQDSVRVRALQSLIECFTPFKKEANINKRVWTIRRLCVDPSWRVRFLAATKFYKLCQLLSVKMSEADTTKMLDIFLKLLKDSEAEVRAAAASQLSELSGTIISEEVMTSKFLTVFKDLSDDQNKYTRAQFAEVLVPIGSKFSKSFVTSNILPLVLILLKDPNPEPRLKCLSRLDLNVVNPSDLSEALMPCIAELVSDDSWRVRESVLEMFPSLSSRLDRSIIDKKIKTLLFQLMNDKVEIVRCSAAKTFLKICQAVNDEKWTSVLLDEIIELKKSSYLRRQAVLVAVQCMVEVLDIKLCIKHLTDFLEDKVPNVRLKACSIFTNLIDNNKIPTIHYPTLIKKFTPLKSDSDPDVSYYAEQTLERLTIKKTVSTSDETMEEDNPK